MTIERSSTKHTLKDLQKARGSITFARLLLAYRASMGLSQIEFAKALGLSKANLCDLEKGRKIPTPSRAQAIAKRLKELPQYWVEVAVQDMLKAQKLAYIVKLKEPKAA